MKILMTLLILFVTAACADPKYVQESSPVPSPNNKLTFDCSQAFTQSGVCMSYKWENIPTEKDPGVMIIRLFTIDEGDGFPELVDPTATLKVALWMPSMGHGSAPVFLEKLKTGTYRATNMYFVMPGQWDMQFQLLSEGVVTDEVVLPFTL